jgi:hypothetical protein
MNMHNGAAAFACLTEASPVFECACLRWVTPRLRAALRGQVMNKFSKYVGLDVHQESIAVAVAEETAQRIRTRPLREARLEVTGRPLQVITRRRLNGSMTGAR